MKAAIWDLYRSEPGVDCPEPFVVAVLDHDEAVRLELNRRGSGEGARVPRVRDLAGVADYFGVTVDWRGFDPRDERRGEDGCEAQCKAFDVG